MISVEQARAVKLAEAEGADVEIVRTSALLHDIGLDNYMVAFFARPEAEVKGEA